jgi:hypothetical protein
MKKWKEWFHDKYLVLQPDFIDNKTKEDQRLFDIIYSTSMIIFNLCDDVCLSDDKINEIITDYLVMVEYVYHNYDEKKYYDVVFHINALMMLMDAQLLKNEYYEALYNLKRFNELL